MGQIGYGYGSEWHLLQYLGYHRNRLNKAITDAIGPGAVEWLDFIPTGRSVKFKEQREWEAIDFIKDSKVQQAWRKFWPVSGTPPCWDAVGKVMMAEEQQWLLVEAKAHVAEPKSPCKATEPALNKIKDALRITQVEIGMTEPEPEPWLRPYYQYCNRLATLHFLNANGISARLILIYFLGDSYHGKICPRSREEWETALRDVHQHIGFTDKSVLEQRIHNVFLPVAPTPD